VANERQQIQVIDPVPLMDTGSFEHLQRIASAMARSSLIPDCLRMTKVVDEDGYPVKENGKAVVELLPYESILANCFLVVEQAVRWGASPFAVAQCVSVVRGKLCYEGKLVAAIVEAKLGVRLTYTYDGKSGDQRGIVVSGKIGGESEVRIVTGTVGAWKTNGNMSPWKNAENHERMLAYRGAREWARRHAPGIMLGVYTDDEMSDLQSGGRTTQLRGIEPVRDALSGEKPKAIEARPAVAETTESLPATPGEGTEAAAAVSVGEEGDVREPLTMSPTTCASGKVLDTPSDPVAEAGEVQQDVSAVEAEKDGPEAENEAQEPTQPTDDASYQRWVFWWSSNLVHSHEEASAKWKAERTIRNRLQISSETVDACKAFLGKSWPAPPANGEA
jgi:hypothetical protein